VTRFGLSQPTSSMRRFVPTSKPDIGLAVVLALFSFVDWVGGARLGSPILAAAGLVVAEVPAIAVAWRARLEVRLLAIAVVCSAAALPLHATDTGIPMLAALYTVAALGSWRRAAVAWAVTCASFAFGVEINVAVARKIDPMTGVFDMIIAAALAAGVVAIGLWVAARSRHIQFLVARNAALQRERDLLERERDLLAREAIAAERARIARELHDVVAHHVSVMVIQAGAAEATLPPDAEATRATLQAVRDSGREALTEMRHMLGVLREPASDAAGAGAALSDSESDGRGPQPGLSQIPALVGRMREAGVATTLEYAGKTRRLSAGVDVSAYRVVQEALTNVVRHAGRGAAARVALTYGLDCLTVEVTDDGRSPGGGSPEMRPAELTQRGGHGLIGMRERVSLFGGTLETGPVRGAGWRVFARFPIDPEPEADPPAPSGRPAAVLGQEPGQEAGG
jgi:signal transduction histidine kinase